MENGKKINGNNRITTDIEMKSGRKSDSTADCKGKRQTKKIGKKKKKRTEADNQ